MIKNLLLYFLLISLLFHFSCGNSLDVNHFSGIENITPEEKQILITKLEKIKNSKLNFIIPLKDFFACKAGKLCSIIPFSDEEQLKEFIPKIKSYSPQNIIGFELNDKNPDFLSIKYTPHGSSPVVFNPNGKIQITIFPEYHQAYYIQKPICDYLEELLKSTDYDIAVLREGAPFQGPKPLQLKNKNFKTEVIEGMFESDMIGFSDYLAIKHPERVKIYGLCSEDYVNHSEVAFKLIKASYPTKKAQIRLNNAINEYKDYIGKYNESASNYDNLQARLKKYKQDKINFNSLMKKSKKPNYKLPEIDPLFGKTSSTNGNKDFDKIIEELQLKYKTKESDNKSAFSSDSSDFNIEEFRKRLNHKDFKLTIPENKSVFNDIFISEDYLKAEIKKEKANKNFYLNKLNIAKAKVDNYREEFNILEEEFNLLLKDYRNPEHMLSRDRLLYQNSASIARSLHSKNKKTIFILQIGAAHLFQVDSSFDENLIPVLRKNVISLLAKEKNIKYDMFLGNLSTIAERKRSKYSLLGKDKFDIFLNPVPNTVFFNYGNQFNFSEEVYNSQVSKSERVIKFFNYAAGNKNKIIYNSQKYKIVYSDKPLKSSLINYLGNNKYFAGRINNKFFIVAPDFLVLDYISLSKQIYESVKNKYIVSLSSNLHSKFENDLVSYFNENSSSEILKIIDSIDKSTGINEFIIDTFTTNLKIKDGKATIPSTWSLPTLRDFVSSINQCNKYFDDCGQFLSDSKFSYEKQKDGVIICRPERDSYFEAMRHFKDPRIKTEHPTEYLGYISPEQFINDLKNRQKMHYYFINMMYHGENNIHPFYNHYANLDYIRN